MISDVSTIILSATLIASILTTLPGRAATRRSGDLCHVYVVDVAKGKKAWDEYKDTGNPDKDSRALAAAQTVFPEFETKVGEEELTTKSYRFPGGRLFITASVYYTDESMGSASGANSMILDIVITDGPAKVRSLVPNNVMAEVTYNDYTDMVRAKKYVKVRGRFYLIGIECRCNPKVTQAGP